MFMMRKTNITNPFWNRLSLGVTLSWKMILEDAGNFFFKFVVPKNEVESAVKKEYVRQRKLKTA